MLKFLRRSFFSPPVFEGDENKTRVAGLLNVILPSMAAVFGLGLALISLEYPAPWYINALLIGLISLFVVLWRLIFRGYVRLSGMLVPFAMLVVIVAAVATFGGIRSSATSGFVLVVILAALLLGRRGAWVYTFFCILALVSLLLAEQSSLLFKGKETAVGSWMDISTYVPVLMLVTMLVNASIQNLETALNNTRSQEVKLAESNQTLQNVLSGLEQTVAERTRDIEQASQAMERQAWESAGLARLAQALSGDQNLSILASNVTRELCEYLDIPMGALFLVENDIFRLMGSYCFDVRKQASPVFYVGEGLVGQAALENKAILLADIPLGYFPVSTGLVQVTPSQVLAIPFSYQGKVLGVMEFALLKELGEAHRDLLNKATESIALAFHTARTRRQVDVLLTQTQDQANTLREREELLKSVNDELQNQAESLRNSQEKLRQQQAELEAANAELEERTATLQHQRSVLDEQNRELTHTKDELQRRAEDLTQANKYKSEFLANMSHELRTPLNSLLILARMLANNDKGNLSPDQVESARIIFNSGSDLLNLINEILDLSKVEAGRMSFHFAPMKLQTFAENMRIQFEHVAREKSLAYEVSVAENLPESLETDQQRVEQIVRNLLANAFKFTEKGAVRLRLEAEDSTLAIRISDTGIGMSAEQQQRVFEAFQQADGSTSRKYGGTGLGLAIAREMSMRLGGRITLESQPGQGSAFTLYLPLAKPPQAEADHQPIASTLPTPQPDPNDAPPVLPPTPAPTSQRSRATIPDDRETIKKGDKILLVIEDDPKFAKILQDYAHKKDFRCLLAQDGENGLAAAREFEPDAILLDLKLPGMSGWDVLDTLKQDASLRHIPVHILSATEETLDAYKRGALGFLSKPVSTEGLDTIFQKIGDFLARDIRNLLVVEDDRNLRLSVRQLLGGNDVKITEAASGQSALLALREHHYDCMILDLTLPDMTGFELLNKINQEENITRCPVIVYTGKALSEEENAELLKYADSVIIKGVKSPERLLDEAALFLHRVVSEMPEEKQRTIRRLHDRDAVFSGKHILVVDDDMRNAFALSRLLNDKGMRTSIARSGMKALEMLEPTNDFDLVLMDIMMPEMDGYETMQRIRSQERYKNLPILALTAKAMKGDQEKCIAAGANDYLSKPVDTERLFSILRVWLYH